MTRPYPQLSPFAIARGEASAGGGGGGDPVEFRGAMAIFAADLLTQNLSGGVHLAFNAEEYDTDNIHDNSSNNTRLTVPAGVTHVRISCGVSLKLHAANQYIRLFLNKGGASTESGMQRIALSTAATFAWANCHSAVLEVVAGDFFEIKVQTQADTSVTIEKAGTWFAMEIVEPAVISGRPTLLHVRDEKSAGTAGGGAAATTWNLRTLNTELTNEITGASLASNQITLAAGTYEIRATAPARKVDRHKLRLQNITDASTELVGMSAHATSIDSGVTMASLFGRFTLTATKVLELQHFTQTLSNTNGLGVETNASVVEVYADVVIEKIS